MPKKQKRDKKKRKSQSLQSSRIESRFHLALIAEIKIERLLANTGKTRYEASGLLYQDGYLYVVLDNATQVVRVPATVHDLATDGDLIVLDGRGNGYEAIAFHPVERRWYCLIEAAVSSGKTWRPSVDVFDSDFTFVQNCWLDFPVESDKKGFEGLSWLSYGDDHLLVGLCEGNDCKDGKAGRKPGKGRMQLFRSPSAQSPDCWSFAGTLKLPASVQFEDYASLDIRNRQITVLSQETSAIWIGRIRDDAERPDDLWADDGHILLCPRDDDGQIRYCNLEGITWLDEQTIAMVSDKTKAGKQPEHCEARDQSIHLFRVLQRR